MLRVCYRLLAHTLHASVKHKTANTIVFQTPQGDYWVHSSDVARYGINVSGVLDYLQASHPVDLAIDDTNTIRAITVKERPAVFETLHQIGKEYEKQAADSFGNVQDVLSVDLNAVAMNSSVLPTQHAIRSVGRMGTSMRRTMNKLGGMSRLRLSTFEVKKADNWGERILNAEADIVLMPRTNDCYLCNTAIAEGVGQLLSNTNGAMYTITKEGETEVSIRPNGDGVFEDIAAVFKDVRLLVGEVTIPQTKVPFKLLQLQRDLDVLGCHALLAEEGADKVLASANDENTVALLWFNGDRGGLADTIKELSLLVQHSDLPVAQKRIVVVYSPYISIVGTMATAAQLRSLTQQLAEVNRSLTQQLAEVNRRMSLLVLGLILPVYCYLFMQLLKDR